MEDNGFENLINQCENAGIKVDRRYNPGYDTSVLSDGSYMIKDINGNYYKIPKNYDAASNLDLVFVLPGQGQGALQKSFRSYDTSSDKIFVFPSAYNPKNIDESAINLVGQMGGNVKTVEVNGFSASGYFASEMAAEIAEKGYNTVLHVTDPHIINGHTWGAKFIDNNLSSRLANNGVSVYLNITTASTYKTRTDEIYNKYVEGGSSVYLLKSDTKYGHSDGYANFLSVAYGDKASDYSIYIVNSDGEFMLLDINNPEVLFVDYDIENIFNENYTILNDVCYNKYSYLKSLNTYNVTNLVSSDLHYSISFSNSIINSIKSDSLLDATTLNIPQGCGPLADAINRCLGLYYDSVGVLFNNLVQEASFVASVGNTIHNVDLSLENNVSANIALLSGQKNDSVVSDKSEDDKV